MFNVAANLHIRVDDVLALQPDLLLFRLTNTGTERIGGGTFERQFLWLLVFRSDGLATQLESFASDREIEALARSTS